MSVSDWRDDSRIMRHRQAMQGEAILRNAERSKRVVSQYRMAKVIDSLFDTNAKPTPAENVGVLDAPNPVSGIAKLPEESRKSREIEARRVREQTSAIETEKFMRWCRGEDTKPKAAHELKFGTQRGFGASRTGMCVCGAEMYAVEYGKEVEMICPNE